MAVLPTNPRTTQPGQPPPARRGRTLPVVLAVLVLVGGLNVAAYAATGKPLLLGRDNVADAVTELRNNAGGPALSLRSEVGIPPLAVSRPTKIDRLNADLVDGLEASQLRTQGWVYSMPYDYGISEMRTGFPDLPPGRYLVTYAVSAGFPGPGHLLKCWFGDVTMTVTALGYGVTSGNGAVLTGTGMVDTRAEEPVLTCTGTTHFTTPGAWAAPGQVVFTQLDVVASAKADQLFP